MDHKITIVQDIDSAVSRAHDFATQTGGSVICITSDPQLNLRLIRSGITSHRIQVWGASPASSAIKGQTSFDLDDIMEEGLTETLLSVMEDANQYGESCVAVDLRLLDQTHYEKGMIGGLSTREMIYAISKIMLSKKMKTWIFFPCDNGETICEEIISQTLNKSTQSQDAARSC